MNYKEFLRVRNTFVTFAITIAAIALFVGLVSGHAKVNVSVDTPSQAASHMASGATPHTATVAAASDSDTTNVEAPGIEVTDTDHGAPFGILLAVAAFVAAIFATVVGTGLAAENCGHLEIAWTRPASRTAYAGRLMLVDILGIAAIFCFTLGVSLALLYAKGWQHYLSIDRDMPMLLARFVAYPLAWFGLVAALTASVRTRAGAIAGFSWVGAAFLLIMLTLNLPPAIHTVVKALNYLNPLLYGSYSTQAEAGRHVLSMTPALAVGGLLGIAIVGIAASLAQWRRLEA